MEKFKPTNYKLESLCCGTIFEDTNWDLNCPHNEKPALIRAQYENKQLTIHEELPGLYQFAEWLPIDRVLKGSGAPVTYRSEGLAKVLGLENLYITFNGYWPEKGAHIQTGTFKEFEAYSVCARKNSQHDKVMVVASAGNTARAFARVCSENKIPLLLCIPKDNLSALWFDKPLDPCVKVVASESGADYFDAIHLSNIAAEMDQFYPEGGAKNVARRDGMALAVVSAVTTIGHIPHYYFQAVGSGTGAIAAWEANLRFIEDGRFGQNKMKLMVSQNAPFLPIKDAWDARSRAMLPLDDQLARKQVEIINAKVLSNRRPPYSLIGGLFDALMDSNGEVLAATNEEADEAARIFLESEGNDVSPAAAVAVASLIQQVKEGNIDQKATVMLNITGGGIEKFKKEHELVYVQPQMIFPIDPDPEMVKAKLPELFR
ncbi:cysteate synthase [Roseimarinus sediminis]|uniref:cysteate synthase n=1 Tax=Roseimarinus sediminis TaxID=1610899 RepID=UPI003D1CB496